MPKKTPVSKNQPTGFTSETLMQVIPSQFIVGRIMPSGRIAYYTNQGVKRADRWVTDVTSPLVARVLTERARTALVNGARLYAGPKDSVFDVEYKAVVSARIYAVRD